MTNDLDKHRLHTGASGRRTACSVCRKADPVIGWGDPVDWKQPCRPSTEALDKREEILRQRIAEAQADLAHVAAHRARLLDMAIEGALSA